MTMHTVLVGILGALLLGGNADRVGAVSASPRSATLAKAGPVGGPLRAPKVSAIPTGTAVGSSIGFGSFLRAGGDDNGGVKCSFDSQCKEFNAKCEDDVCKCELPFVPHLTDMKCVKYTKGECTKRCQILGNEFTQCAQGGEKKYPTTSCECQPGYVWADPFDEDEFDCMKWGQKECTEVCQTFPGANKNTVCTSDGHLDFPEVGCGCKAGFVWKDPENPDNYACVSGSGDSSSGSGSGSDSSSSSNSGSASGSSSSSGGSNPSP